MQMKATRVDAANLLLRGSIALAYVEETGICVDLAYFAQQRTTLERELITLRESLDHMKEGQAGRKKYGTEWSPSNNSQLAVILALCGHKLPLTEKGNASVSEASLPNIDGEFVQCLLRIRKLEKIVGTYITGIEREAVEGKVHPVFNLHTVRTYRSSCDSPNLQNIPVRDEEAQQIVRSGFYPRKGNLLLEADYGGQEVRVACCYCRDPQLIKDTLEGDMHRDEAAAMFKIPARQVTKKLRYLAKNGWVFPQFYGSWFGDCATNIWEEAAKLPEAKEALRAARFNSLASFETHLKELERRFWFVRFPVYRKWRETRWAEYQRDSYFDTLTGFRCSGMMKRNDVLNYPIQGSAFHCLLWSLIQIHDWLVAQRMKTRIVNQVHDSILFDVYPPERARLEEKLMKVMRHDIQQAWPWVSIPLEVEIEETGVDEPWSKKRAIAKEAA